MSKRTITPEEVADKGDYQMAELIRGASTMKAIFTGMIRVLARVYGELTRDLSRQLFCGVCGKIQPVEPAICSRFGWPRCHGRTMSHGEERL